MDEVHGDDLAMVVRVLNVYLRPYQIEILMDFSRKRIILKSRQIGITQLMALEMVLVASGLFAKWVMTADCLVLSLTLTDATEVVRRARTWIEVLKLALSPRAATFVDAFGTKTRIEFKRSRRAIIARAQSPDAGRSLSGHLYRDEWAKYRYQESIAAASNPIIASNPRLRVVDFSTPFGNQDRFHETWVREDQGYSKHHIDVHRAVADGFPFNITEEQSNYTIDQWDEEFLTKFISQGHDYFSSELMAQAREWVTEGPRPAGKPLVYLGIDVASIVDTTVCQVIRTHPAGHWTGETYIISRTPYRSNPFSGAIGQDLLLDMLVSFYAPDDWCVDVTGEGRKLYQYWKDAGRPPRAWHSTQGLKNAWVPNLRLAMEQGVFHLGESKTFMYDAGKLRKHLGGTSKDVVVQGALRADAVHMRAAFKEFPANQLEADFQSVFKTMTPTQGVTFNTQRTAQGHGDAFWACLYAYHAAQAGHLRRI